MKTSKIKRLLSKKRVRELDLGGKEGDGLRAAMESEAAEAIDRMRQKGYELITCLQTGEGVFIKEANVVGLHIQLPRALYRKLDVRCREHHITKRSVVVAALESYLA